MKLIEFTMRLLVISSVAWYSIALAEISPIMLQKGIASYYDGSFDGHLTANGEIFDNQELTAAHRWLPFGTRVQITNLTNSKSVIVVINDRGPFVKNRIIDLTQRAAKHLQMLESGLTQVELKVLSKN